VKGATKSNETGVEGKRGERYNTKKKKERK
jgi:hypothetical protein